ncbi:MAG: Holliday junction resolvase RuvX [Acutalibacteraceae bacterium]
MIILSVDYGDARTGVAVSDKTEFLASPVEVIHSAYQPNVISRICEICDSYKPELIVVGLPKNMDSSIGERAQRCIDFADELSKKCGIKTVMWDERLTTVSAHHYLNQTNTRGKKRKNTVDAVAAVIILQSYLDHRKINT